MAAARLDSGRVTAGKRRAQDLPVPLPGERVPRQDVERLLELTHDPSAGVRTRAVMRLCPCHIQGNEERVWDRLIAMTDDPDSRVRGQVLHALADGSPHAREAEVVAALEGMWHDPDPHLRRRVRRLLAEYRRTGRINVL
jgi:hypothetical protein